MAHKFIYFQIIFIEYVDVNKFFQAFIKTFTQLIMSIYKFIHYKPW